tara:strand:- start:58 stop:711 length:654 start_codon:yes stop_codon:yes gene_type:complete
MLLIKFDSLFFMKNVYLFLFSIFSISLSSAEIDAPLGVKWGLTKYQLNGMSVKLSDCEILENGVEMCKATNTPKSLSFADSVFFYFHYKKKTLEAVYVSGKTIENDVYGSQGKEDYDKVKASLYKKYPESSGYTHTEYEVMGLNLYDQNDEFYQCLNYEGCGYWISFVSGMENSVYFQLNGIGRGLGYLGVKWESPEWEKMLDAIADDVLTQDEDAL